MATPVVTCGANVVLSYSAGSQVANLSATATAGATTYAWTLLSVPIGSTAASETRGSFINGVASVQSPTFDTDAALEGAYVFQCIATAGSTPSLPDSDKESAQQVVIVKTDRFNLTFANDYQWDWGDYVTNSLSLLEAAIGTPGGAASGDLGGTYPSPTVLNVTASGIQLTLDSISDGQFLKRVGTDIVGSAAEGGGGGGVPSAHATSHESGGSDAIQLDDLATPDDNTDLDVTTVAHGLCPKLSNVVTEFLNGTGSFSTPAGSGSSSLAIDEYIAAGGDEWFVPSGTPAVNSDTPSGRSILAVTVQGVGTSYAEPPTDSYEFAYTTVSGIQMIDLAAGDLVEVRYLK